MSFSLLLQHHLHNLSDLPNLGFIVARHLFAARQFKQYARGISVKTLIEVVPVKHFP